VRECLRQVLTMVNECVLLVMQQKRDASKQSKLVASVCGEVETVVSAKRRRDRPTYHGCGRARGTLSSPRTRQRYPALSTLHHLQLGRQSRFVCIGAVATYSWARQQRWMVPETTKSVTGASPNTGLRCGSAPSRRRLSFAEQATPWSLLEHASHAQLGWRVRGWQGFA